MNMPLETLDLSYGFQQYEGASTRISQQILVDERDTAAGTGKRTRPLHLAPGLPTAAAHDQPCWQEGLVIKGSMIESMPETAENRVTAPAYACSQPEFMQRPIRTDEECLLIEFPCYDEVDLSAR